MLEREFAHDLNFAGKDAEQQVQNFWQNEVDKHFRNREFGNENEIIDEFENGLFRNKNADDFLIDRAGLMRNLRYINVETKVPIVWGIHEQIKNATIKFRVLFRLIIDDVDQRPQDYIRSTPNFLEDSYLDPGGIQVSVN